MIERLDEERVEILRQWGAGLASDPREELRAAGKAITVLIDEIDRLQVELWNVRMEQRDTAAEERAAEQRAAVAAQPQLQPAEAETVASPTAQGATLRERLARSPRIA